MLRRYLLKEVVAPFGAWTAFLCVLFFVMAFLRGMDFLLGSAVTAWDFVRFTAALMPQFLVQAIPIALLLATLLGLGRLADDRELVAMQALGVQPRLFFRGPLALGLVLTLVLAGLSFTLQPWGMRSLRRIAHEIIRRNLVSDIRSGVFHEEVPDFTLYAEKVEPGNKWTNVLLFDGRDKATPLLALGARGAVQPDELLENVVFVLENGSVHRAQGYNEDYSTVEFSRAEFKADVGGAFFQKNNFRSVREEYSPLELLDARKAAFEKGEPTLPIEVTLHWRFGQALMPLSFAFLGTPLALSRRGGGRAFSVLFSLFSYVGYYLLARAAVQVAEKGELAPALAGQAPNLLFVVAGLLLMLRVERRGAA
ncbi:MAG: LptF/LptG family permease [Archangium sp.]|nr:LptF/LptG family permease [Archangium sp.]